MKAVILAGGLGSRLGEETTLRPKPMVEIGGRPILWHILKIYSYHGVNDFVICLGYKGYVIKEYFANYLLHSSDVTFDIAQGTQIYYRITSPAHALEPWKVTLADTGDRTGTAGRLKRVAQYLDPGEPFCMTYGDGLADIDITASIRHHQQHGKLATVTAVRQPARFGALKIRLGRVTSFMEKPEDAAGDGGGSGWINGGFFVLSPHVLDQITDDGQMFENEPMQRLTAAREVEAYIHDGFWQPMDTIREKERLEQLWASGAAPWKVW